MVFFSHLNRLQYFFLCNFTEYKDRESTNVIYIGTFYQYNNRNILL